MYAGTGRDFTGSGGVDTFTGQIVITSEASISSNGFKVPFSTALAYDSQNYGTSVGFGNGWRPVSLASLVSAGGNIYYSQRPGSAKEFVPQGGTYRALFFVEDVLAPVTGGYRMQSPDGSSRTFDSSGRLTGIANPGGDVATVTYSGTEVTSVSMTVSGESWEYAYNWSGGKVDDIIYKVNGREVLKTVYGYDGSGQLLTIKLYENSTAGTGTPVWGTPIQAARYSYNPGLPILRHVVPPAEYRQMENNGINPDTATETQLDAYAETRYDYSGGGDTRIVSMWTHGARYRYDFAYFSSLHTGDRFNVWQSKTEVSKPGEVVETFYFNGAGEVMLKRIEQKSGGTATKTWYPVAQRFETGGGARIVLSAGGTAIASVSESSPGLFTLVSTGAAIEEYAYNSDGLLAYTTVRNGTAGTANKLREYTYVSGHGNVRPVASETVYRNEGNSGPITTGYAYAWHGTTNQISSRTTTLPTVTTAENGRGLTVTRVENFDSTGYLTSEVDERGSETTYQYDKVRGGMTVKIEDAGSGRLNLRTDYTLDDRGRTVRELGPAHDAIYIGGSATNVRSARWTYYKDREGQTMSFRGFQTTGGSPVDQIIGPVTVSEPNLAPPAGYTGWRLESTYDAPYGSSGIPSPSSTFSQGSWLRWRVRLLDESSEMKEEWSYINIPSSGYGAQSTNYGKKLFAYDVAGRLNQTTCAGGTIDKTTFNAMGWAVTEELGTSAGLTVVETKEYNDDGNLTKRTRPVDSTTARDRVTDYRYDWRKRLDEEETSVENGSGGSWLMIGKSAYDNRDLVVSRTGYHTSVTNANRTSHSTTDYDVLGRSYRTQVYGVNAATGATSNPQVSNTYYEPGGLVARDAPAGSTLFAATQYDAVGRPLKSFQAYEPSGFTPGSDPASVSSAVVMEQQELSWDAAGNLLGTVSRLRFDTATGNGELQNASTQPAARASYVASYPDTIGRVVATADYGASAGGTWTRPSSIPARSSTVLVNSIAYNTAGNIVNETDPAGTQTTRSYDDADRLITLVENAAGTAPEKRTTGYEYTDDGWLKKLISENADTGQQVTEWVYGVTPSNGSALYSNRQVYQKLFPDAANPVTYAYNRQLQLTGQTDQVGTARSFTYDKLGRLLADTVTAFGTGVDNAVGKLENGYNERGLRARATSYNTAGTTKLNEVAWEYNDFNQPVAEYQEHAGGVNTATSLKVGYGYANGSANTTRPTSVKYPHVGAASAATVDFHYGTTMADALSRIDEIRESGTTLSSWRYVGLGMVVAQKYDAAADTELTYGSAADTYSGYDRFGRIVATLWKTGTTVLVESKYGRDTVGDIEWRKDVKAHALSVVTQDNYYQYDGLRQVRQHERGELTPSGGPPYTGITAGTRQQQELFTYDETGNWSAYQAQSPALNQSRDHNEANQITAITNPTGVVQPAYDGAGNLTTMPAPADWTKAYACKWDAWNRLVEIKDGTTLVGSFAYDALARRIIKSSYEGIRYYFYDSQWRALEERIAGFISRQFTWNPYDRWNLIRRKRTISGGTLNETRYVLRDYLDPVAIIAIVDDEAVVDERFGYDAFGDHRFMDANFVDRSSSTVAWNWLFHGEFVDIENGLYNYGYRYYHPQLGRWLSRDPFQEQGGRNLFSFSDNNSINARDLVGLVPIAPGLGPWTAGIDIPASFINSVADLVWSDLPDVFPKERICCLVITGVSITIYIDNKSIPVPVTIMDIDTCKECKCSSEPFFSAKGLMLPKYSKDGANIVTSYVIEIESIDLYPKR